MSHSHSIVSYKTSKKTQFYWLILEASIGENLKIKLPQNGELHFFVVIVATRSFGKSFDLIQANSAAFEYETQTRALIERLKVLFV